MKNTKKVKLPFDICIENEDSFFSKDTELLITVNESDLSITLNDSKVIRSYQFDNVDSFNESAKLLAVEDLLLKNRKEMAKKLRGIKSKDYKLLNKEDTKSGNHLDVSEDMDGDEYIDDIEDSVATDFSNLSGTGSGNTQTNSNSSSQSTNYDRSYYDYRPRDVLVGNLNQLLTPRPVMVNNTVIPIQDESDYVKLRKYLGLLSKILPRVSNLEISYSEDLNNFKFTITKGNVSMELFTTDDNSIDCLFLTK